MTPAARLAHAIIAQAFKDLASCDRKTEVSRAAADARLFLWADDPDWADVRTLVFRTARLRPPASYQQAVYLAGQFKAGMRGPGRTVNRTVPAGRMTEVA